MALIWAYGLLRRAFSVGSRGRLDDVSSLLQSSYSKYIPNDAWYDMYIVQSNKITEPIQKHIKTTYIATKKYLVYPTKEQHEILQKWFK